MSRATKASIQSADPNYTKDGSLVTKTLDKQGGNDKVVVSAFESGVDKDRNAVIVLKIDTGDGPTVATQADGSVLLTASDVGKVNYMCTVIASSNPNNWTLKVHTSGGSIYTYKKGNGGSGRK